MREGTISLVIGAEFGRVDVGIISDGKWTVCESREGRTSEGLGPLLREVLQKGNLHPLEPDEWIYSGGPGSLLGLRSLAMILETWSSFNEHKPILKRRFSGMVWTARSLQASKPEDSFLLISPWRTGAWNALEGKIHSKPKESDLTILEEISERTHSVFCLGSRPGSVPPPGTLTVDLPEFHTLIDEMSDESFLTETRKAEPIQTGKTTYRRWDSKPHAAS